VDSLSFHLVQISPVRSGAFFVVDGVLASDKNRDVAIIKAHGNDFKALTLGDSDRLQVGEEVVAIGNPLSLESTVSNGIVSAFRTDENEGGKFVQITAPISPGSSGGPLFNMAGEVVGITTSHLVGGDNLNFAIPMNDVKPMLLAGFSKLHSLPDEPEPVSAEPTTGDPKLLVTPNLMAPISGEVSIVWDFSTAFAADPECSGIALIADGSIRDPVMWSMKNNSWWVSGHVGEGFFNWALYGRDQSFAADGKTSEEAAHKICTIVKGKGGQIRGQIRGQIQ
jgi:hypothetical protein